MRRRDFWHAVGLYRGVAEARRDWSAAAGADAAVFERRYLKATATPVAQLVCPLRCGCMHRLGRSDGASLWYDCDCDEQQCPSFEVPVTTAAGLEFKARDFFLALADVLGIDRGNVVYAGQVGTVHLGRVNVGGQEAWVFLVATCSGDEQREPVAALLQKYSHRPVAVLMPDYPADVGTLVERNGGAAVELRGYVRMCGDGSLAADEKLAERLARGAVPVIAARKAAPAVAAGQYALVARGRYVRTGDGESHECDQWSVIFDGQEALLPETDGALYVTHLITCAGTVFSAKALYDAVRGVHAAVESTGAGIAMAAGDVEEEDEDSEQDERPVLTRGVANERDVIWNREQIEKVEIHLRKLQEAAVEVTDRKSAAARTLRRKIEDTVTLLEANSKLVRGKRLPLDYRPGDFARMSDTIRKAVRAFLKAMDAKLPGFAKHLRDKSVLTYGVENRYKKTYGIDWKVLR